MKIKYIITILIVLLVILLSAIWWRYVPLTDGTYVVSNNKIAWHISVSNGILLTTFIENKSTGEKLEMKNNSKDFVFRLGHANSINWAPEHKKPSDKWPPFMVRDAITVSPELCRAVRLIRGWRTWKFVLHQPTMNCNIYLIFSAKRNENWIRRRIELQSCNPAEQLATDQAAYHVKWNVEANPSLGGKGQPLFLDETWFVALEHPFSRNNYENGQIVLKQFPGYRFGTKPLALQSMVIGCGEKKVAVRKTMDSYVKSIRRPARSLSLYNTWSDLRDDNFTEENMAKSAAELKKGFAPYEFSLDVFAVDDGWFNLRSIWEYDKKKLPGGFASLNKRIENEDMKLGLWNPISGHSLDTSWGKENGINPAHSKYYCVSDPKYNKLLRNHLKKTIVNGKICYFKHDFNYFGCGQNNHGHFPSTEQSTEVNVDAEISILKMEAELNPEIFLAITTGIWPSPWWLPYVDTIWMGGGDHAYNKKLPATFGSAFEMNYRDGALYKIVVEDGKIFPLSALMTHGIVDGRHTAYPVKYETDEGWANYVMNYFGRGTLMRELYITPSNLTEKRWEIMARALRWAKSLDQCMIDSEFFLGNPKKGELFGYTGENDGLRFVSMRNPQLTNITVTASQLLVTNGICEVVFPYHEFIIPKNDSKISIAGEAVWQAETYPVKNLKIPVPINVRSELIESSETETIFEISYPANEKTTFEIISPVKIKSVIAPNFQSTFSDDYKRQFLSIENPAQLTQLKPILDNYDFSKDGVFKCRVFAPENYEVKLKLLLNRFLRIKASMVNGKTINVAGNKGQGWQLFTIPCLAGTNNVTIVYDIKNQSVQNIKSELYLVEDKILTSQKITITHAAIKPVDKLNKPYPLLQNKERKTVRSE